MSNGSYFVLFLALCIICICVALIIKLSADGWADYRQDSTAKAKRKFIESKMAEHDQSRLDNEDRKRGI